MTTKSFNLPGERPFTRLAARMLGESNLKALDEGKCPTCKGLIGPFRDGLSIREFRISGMCQECQDEVFGTPEE